MSHLGAYWKVYVGCLKPWWCSSMNLLCPRILALRLKHGLSGTTTGTMTSSCGNNALDEKFTKAMSGEA